MIQYIELTKQMMLDQPFKPDAKAVAMYQGRADADTQRTVLFISLMLGSIINHMPPEARQVMGEYAEQCMAHIEEKIRKESN